MMELAVNCSEALKQLKYFWMNHCPKKDVHYQLVCDCYYAMFKNTSSLNNKNIEKSHDNMVTTY